VGTRQRHDCFPLSLGRCPQALNLDDIAFEAINDCMLLKERRETKY
jgi:hypothetical protein